MRTRRISRANRTIATGIERSAVFLLVLSLALSGPAAGVAKSPLADAAEKLDRAGVRALLKGSVDVNAPQVDGMTALHWAAYQDKKASEDTLVFVSK